MYKRKTSKDKLKRLILGMKLIRSVTWDEIGDMHGVSRQRIDQWVQDDMRRLDED